MILGISGPYGAGKTAVVAFLVERSFAALSLSDLLREELGKRGLSETRQQMIALGNELRANEGPDTLARRALSRLQPDRNYVIDSIRHPAEVDALRRAGTPFQLLWIDCDEATRLRRVAARARPGDPKTQSDFRHLEGKELESEDPAAQQLLAVRAMADEVIWNEGSLESLFESVQAILRKSLHFERPGWDDYFMSVARVVASRSNCVKRKVAAVVTIDRRIVSTGYNGTPRGVRNCNEGGCPRCSSFGVGGADLGECLCSHGEENAITQAAYHGVSLRGATLYSTYCPCLLCTKMIINAGIAEVVYNSDYPLGEVSLALLREAGVKVRQTFLG
jgi:dCMP deaminase